MTLSGDGNSHFPSIEIIENEIGPLLAATFCMLEDFFAYRVSREIYWISKDLRLPGYLKEQLLRASSSVTLNLAEGSGKKTAADQQKFYSIAAGSLRECQAVLDLERVDNPRLRKLVAQLGAITFKLSQPQKLEKVSKKRPGQVRD